ncbi:leptin receptor isoform X2 [Polypterus senegalus]|uniref:leptin receptor isoform X2 n=1 Tax=Polypterus senegalus TaxID=55291 RepID=UPI00196357C5|nr:leptin receptor isoform X2 [Polypterus senegalus]
MFSSEKVTLFLHLSKVILIGGFVQSLINSPAASLQIPPRNFTLFWNLSSNKAGWMQLLSTYLDKNVHKEETWNSNLTGLADIETSNGDNSSVYTYNFATTGRKGFYLNILCWVEGNLEHLICNLKPSKIRSGKNMSLTIELLHAKSDVSLREFPERYEKASLTPIQKSCYRNDTFNCDIHLLNLNDTYSLSVKLYIGQSSFESPMMEVNPMHIVKPHPPQSLQYDLNMNWQLELRWEKPEPTPYELQYEVRCSADGEHVMSKKVLVDTFVDLHGLKAGVNYTTDIRCKCLRGPGYWSDWSSPVYVNVQDVTYIPPKVLTTAGSNVTVNCIFNNRNLKKNKIVWWLNTSEKIPEQLYSVVDDHVSTITLVNIRPSKPKTFDLLQCCEQYEEHSDCNYRYAEIYAIDANFDISCETNENVKKMICKWNPHLTPLPAGSKIKFLYKKLVSCVSKEEIKGFNVEECPLTLDSSYQCTFQSLHPILCHMMWIEVHHNMGIVRSNPTYVTPMDVVRPHPPFNIKAEITQATGLLNISWERTQLPTYDLQYEVNFKEDGKNSKWKTHNSTINTSVLIQVTDPCVVYVVQLRCRRYQGPGYWSAWSSAVNTEVHDVMAPTKGPDFWRIIHEDKGNLQVNITLLLKSVRKEDALCSVEGFIIEHHMAKGLMWSSECLSNTTVYTFPWREVIHMVTVKAYNSLGSSKSNYNLTLSSTSRKVQYIQSFSASLINNSCVLLSWEYLPSSLHLDSFVVEWRNQEEEESGLKWIRVPPQQHQVYISDSLFALRECKFTVYPIFRDGEGQSVTTFVNYKDTRWKIKGERAAYILLFIIAFLSIVLFVTLAISQHQMKKLVWKDVPNPNNCSWAQGIDFRTVETIENLFTPKQRHPTGPLFLESEQISEAVIVEDSAEENSLGADVLVLPVCGHELDMNSSNSGSFCSTKRAVVEKEVYLEGSRQSKIEYATILVPKDPCELSVQLKSSSSFSDEGNFSANNSVISGSIPSSLWDTDNRSSLCLTPMNQHISSSFNSSEGFSEASDREDSLEEEQNPVLDLYYLGQRPNNTITDVTSSDRKDETCPEAKPLLNYLSAQNENWNKKDLHENSIRLYMPQFRGASTTNRFYKITKAH